MGIMKKLLAIAVSTLIFLNGLKLNAQQDNPMESLLPPTENLLIHFMSRREENLKNLINYIQIECEGRKLKFCHFPQRLQKYLQLQAQIFQNKEELIYFPDIESLPNDPITAESPWNLSKILSHNYILRPNPLGNDTSIEQIAELLVQKKEILNDLDLIDKELKKFRHEKTLMGYYLSPTLKASINNISPLGAMLELFYNMKCSLEDSYCLYLKARIGCVLNEISKQHSQKILSFSNRFNRYTAEENTQKGQRLKSLLEFNNFYHGYQMSDRNEFLSLVKKNISDFVADGEGGFSGESTQQFAQHIILLSEVYYFTQHMIQLTPYENELSKSSKEKALKALSPSILESMNIIETQFKLLGFDEELGE